ncbi:RdgB/HAM1 family non-canonical purine NTP pyrophosphatase [Breznakiellaceae bacterium SP9]
MTILFASGNVHKKAELSAVLAGHTLHIPAELGLPFNPAETGATFLDNALLKARYLFELLHTLKTASRCAAVIADDSGLCVDALGGRPGVYSARYGASGGKVLSDRERNELLLKELGSNPQRSARFVCAMVCMLNEHTLYAVQEILEGELVADRESTRGSGGFGYDPLLYLPQFGKTAAELSMEEKNRVSHRGKAGRQIAKLLEGIA